MITRSRQDTKKTAQVILNNSYDEDFNILAVELLGYDGTQLRRIKTTSTGAIKTTL